jgi:hypothetical protein
VIRGELSNRAAPIIAIDGKILLEQKQKKFQVFRKVEMKLLDGAKGWLERTWQARICVVVIGKKAEQEAAKILLQDLVPEIEFFERIADLWAWLGRNPQIVRFYTNDSYLQRINSGINVQRHSGWNQKI